MGKNKIYIVWKGRHLGFFHNWEDCNNSVKNFPDPGFASFNCFYKAYDRLKAEFDKTGKKIPKEWSDGPALW